MWNKQNKTEEVEDRGMQIASRRYLENRRKNKLRKLYVFLAIILFIGLVHLVFYSPVFYINELELSRENNQYSLIEDEKFFEIFNQQISQKKLGFLSQRNIFIFDQQEFIKKVNQLSEFNSVNVDKQPNLNINLSIVEQEPVAIFLHENKKYYLGPKGGLIRELSLEEAQKKDDNLVTLFFSVIDDSSETAEQEDDNKNLQEENEEEKVKNILTQNEQEKDTQIKLLEDQIKSFDFLLNNIDKNRIDFVLKIKEMVEKNIEDLKVDRFEFLDPQVSDLRAHTDKDYFIYFDQENDLDLQIINLRTILEQKLKNQQPRYIDLRYKDRVYYK